MNDHLKGTTALTQVDPLKADFRNFVYAVWKHLGLPDPTEVQYDISQFLQHGPRRLMIQAFRGVGKSWLTVAFVLWLLYCDPQLKILVVSASAVKANEFSSMTKSLIYDMPILAHLKPKADQRQSMISFDVGPANPDQSPSVKSVGITGQMAGSRANVIVADDVEIPKNSDTATKRDKLLNDVKEFDAVLKPGGRVIWLGTPQTEQTIYKELPARGYTIRIWPSQIPGDPEGKLSEETYAERHYSGMLSPYILQKIRKGARKGDPVDPMRFDLQDLSERRLSYGKAGYDLQFMLDTRLSDASKYPLKLSDLIVHPLDPLRGPSDLVWASSPDLVWNSDLPMVGMSGDRYHRPAWISQEYRPYAATIMQIDPSGRGLDETAYVILKFMHGRLFLVSCGGFLEGYTPETLKAILMEARKWDVNRILVEPNFGGGMFAQLLKAAAREHYPCTIEDSDWSKTQKEVRIIDTLEPIIEQHRLVVSPDVIQKDYLSTEDYDSERSGEYRLFYQLTHITKDKGALNRDDRLDALAGAVAFFLPSMSVHTETAHLQSKKDDIQKELDNYMQGVLFGRDVGGAQSGRKPVSSILRANNRIR